jgi:hypothetical protein
VVTGDIGEALGQVMGLLGIGRELSLLDAIQKRFGANPVMVVKLNWRDRLVFAEEVIG